MSKDNKIEIKPTKIKFKEGISGAAHDRGESFIAAAYLIAQNIEDHNKAIELNKYILLLERDWIRIPKEQKSLKDLSGLEELLIKNIHSIAYDNSKKIKFKHVKDELDNAENHVNWKEREIKITNMENKNKENKIDVILRKEIPISTFTEAQTREWERILTSNPPEWFTVLPKWEQRHFKMQLAKWKHENPRPNLGTFLGSVPTTIRRYPGAPNAYVTNVTLSQEVYNEKTGKNEHREAKFLKIRSGVVVPVKMAAKTDAEKKVKIEITKQNIEQLVAIAIQEKIKELALDPSFKKGEPISIPILLQTLYSPPVQPPGVYNNEAMKKAMELVRADLDKNPQRFVNKHIPQSFYDENKLNKTDFSFGKIDCLYSNRPVNNARGPAWWATVAGWQGRENRRTDKILADYVNKLPETTDKQKEDKALAKAALLSYQKMPYLRNTIATKPPTNNNALAEKAALEQILCNKVGVRVGSCVSGKDREEMITQIAIAQQQFFLKHGHFPPPAGSNKNERKEFVTLIAHQYLNGHGNELAGENSKGCDGLKNIVDVLGKDVRNKIVKIAPEYGIDPKVFHPTKDIDIIAGLNKLSIDKILANSKEFVERFTKQLNVNTIPTVFTEPKEKDKDKKSFKEEIQPTMMKMFYYPDDLERKQIREAIKDLNGVDLNGAKNADELGKAQNKVFEVLTKSTLSNKELTGMVSKVLNEDTKTAALNHLKSRELSQKTDKKESPRKGPRNA